VRQIAPTGSPSLRFGGDSTDWTWWPNKGLTRPLGIRYWLSRRWLAVTRATATALHARLILGLNLEADSRALVSSEARALLTGLGRKLIAGFELGNEPEVYGSMGWYTRSGQPVRGRARGYDFATYLADYATMSAALPKGVPLLGPASGAPSWVAGTTSFLAANPRVREATFHTYPLHRCWVRAGSSTYPTIPHLLAPESAEGSSDFFASAVAAAHARGIPFRVDELNSVSCKGARGVSDTFASALWALDTLFHLDQIGVDGVNIHTLDNVPYEPFSFARTRGRWRASVRPLYYGLLFFTRAAPAGSRLLFVSQQPSTTLHTWATEDRSGTVRVTVINTSGAHSSTLALDVPGAQTSATVERLTAPSLRATRGVSLAGQSFGTSSTTGQLSGRLRVRWIGRIERRFLIRVPPASAALVTVVSPRAAARRTRSA